jgi:hypothetical protein
MPLKSNDGKKKTPSRSYDREGVLELLARFELATVSHGAKAPWEPSDLTTKMRFAQDG